MGKNPLEASSFTERQRLTFIVYLDPFWGRQTKAAPGLPVWPGLHLNMAALNFLNGDQGSRGECLKRQEVLDASSKGWVRDESRVTFAIYYKLILKAKCLSIVNLFLK